MCTKPWTASALSAIEPAVWREVARVEHAPGAGDEAAFAFVAYERT